VLVLVLVVFAALQHLHASTLKFLQCLLTIVDPLLAVMQTVAVPIEKFGVDVCSRHWLNEFQLRSLIPSQRDEEFVIDRLSTIDRLARVRGLVV
jgi:hypothetical protein